MKICIGVSGSAGGKAISKELNKKAFVIGREIAKAGAILVTGATTGLPLQTAKGAKKEGGLVVGISPAENKKEHIKKYESPVKQFDYIVYTGFGRKGRNVVFARSCDALICISGRIGTLNEFTTAYDEGRPIGVLKSGGISDLLPRIIKIANKGDTKVIYESNEQILVSKLIKILRKKK